MLVVNDNICTGCGSCLKVCPIEALSLANGKIKIKESCCSLCALCVNACPEDAIAIKKVLPSIKDAQIVSACGIWILAEQRKGVMPEVVSELLGQGRRLATDLGTELSAILLGTEIEFLVSELFILGADRVYLVDDFRLAKFNDDIYCNVIVQLIRSYQPEILLLGATSLGRSLAPRIATAIATGLTADCTSLAIDKERRLLLQTRPAFGGNIMATIVCPFARPQMATVRPRVMKKGFRQEGHIGKLVRLTIDQTFVSVTSVIEEIIEYSEQINLAEAEIVVVGGRGLGTPNGFKLARNLAKALGGVVGATRGAVDAGWIGHIYQVGQTGRTIAPKLYIGLGVSGAIQHLVGMQSSEVIVAVNNNFNAPIFQVATYGIIADLNEVVPAMLERLIELRA